MSEPRQELPPVYLSGASLLSKWGFSDGDLLIDWAWDNLSPEDADKVARDNLLIELVGEYLMPKLVSFNVELEEILTTHNPIRARAIDGIEVDQYALMPNHPVADVEVFVPADVIIEKIRVSQSETDTALD